MALSNLKHTPEGRKVRATLKTGEKRLILVGCNDRENEVIWVMSEDCNYPLPYADIQQISVPLNKI